MGRMKKYIGIVLLALILLFTYYVNARRGTYLLLSGNSEPLVMGTIYNAYIKDDLSSLKPYGLGLYYSYSTSTAEVLSNDSYQGGYSLDSKYIAVAMNQVTQQEFQVGYQLEFFKGQTCTITDVVYDDTYMYVGYDYPEQLTYGTAGSIELIKVFDANGKLVYGGHRNKYTSSVGLQGIVFAAVSLLVPITYADNLAELMCITCMVLVAMCICILINKKYNIYMAAVFYATFLLSPMLIAFASNTYWLEGLLFSSMLIGLWISLDCFQRRRRIAAYVASFLYVMIKSMCGYEYITVVMLLLICFLLADGLAAIANKMEKRTILTIFRTIFGIGCCALLGFAVALCVHGYLRGEGNIGVGLKDIYEQDVLRRTLGGNPDNFDASLTDSLTASIPSVLLKYFDFKNNWYATDFLVGISGAVFPFLCLASCILCLIGRLFHIIDQKEGLLYFLLFITCISWYVLGKSHSAVHTHLNFVLWYFGYIQMVLYVMVKYIYSGVKRVKSHLWKK